MGLTFSRGADGASVSAAAAAAVAAPVDPPVAVRHMTAVFVDPSVLADRSPDAVDAALVALLGPGGDAAAVWDATVPLTARRACVRAMGRCVEGPISRGLAPVACYSWWELVWLARLDVEAPGRRCTAITDTIVDVLQHLLDTGSPTCQESALHGLGHVDHPRAKAIVRGFLAAHPDLAFAGRVRLARNAAHAVGDPRVIRPYARDSAVSARDHRPSDPS